MFLMTLQSTITKGLNSGVAMSYKSDITGDKTPFNSGVAMSCKAKITGDKTTLIGGEKP